MSDNFDDEEDSRGTSSRTGREKKLVRGKPFMAGHSGNYAGRPKVENTRDIRALAREYTDLALETLVEVCSNVDEKGSARVAAAGAILDRGWGKAPQTVVLNEGPDIESLDDSRLNEAARDALAGILGIDISGAGEAKDKGKLN